MRSLRSRRRHTGSDDLWWYCLKHARVEHGAGCRDDVRLGPYDTREDAASAPARVAARNKEWDASDE